MKKALEDIFEPKIPVVPPSWAVLPFEQAADVVSDKGKRVKQGSYLLAGKIPIIDQGQDAIGGYTDDEDMAFDDELPVILFGDHTRSFKYIDKRFAVGAEGVKILRPREGYVPKFFYYLLRSLQIPSRGYSRHFQFLRKFHLPLAPEEQQRNIVAEIEKQFSRLDEAVANLKHVKANLKRYKASVLKAAVEGKLTVDWRKQHPNVEPASKLLERILAERREKWHRKGEYKEPATPNIGDPTALPEAPEGWAFASMEQLLPSMREAMKTGPFGSLLKKHEHKVEGVPVLGIENIEAMRFVRGSKIHITQKKAEDLVDYKVMPDDVLISRSGTVGEVCVVPEDIGEARISTNLMKVSLARDGMLPKFFILLFNGSPFVLNQVSDLCKGSTRNFLNQEILKQLCFVLPPLPEQREIVGEVERRLSVIEELEATVQANLTRADRLREAVLKHAFTGKLINQSSNSVVAKTVLARSIG